MSTPLLVSIFVVNKKVASTHMFVHIHAHIRYKTEDLVRPFDLEG